MAQPDTKQERPTGWRGIWEPTRSVLSTLGFMAALMMGMAVLMARGPSASQAPAFVAPTAEGGQLTLVDGSHRPVVLYFWATWCGACKMTSPTVSNYAKRHPEVRVIGVAVDEPAAVRAYLKDTPRNFKTVFDDGRIAKRYGIQAYPTTFAIGSHGRVNWSRQGVLMPGELDLRAGE